MLSDGSSSPLSSSPWPGQGQQAMKPEGVLRTPSSRDRKRCRCGVIPSPRRSEGDVAVREVRLRRRLRGLAGLRLAEGMPEALVEVAHTLLRQRLPPRLEHRPVLADLVVELPVLAFREELDPREIVRTVEVGVEAEQVLAVVAEPQDDVGQPIGGPLVRDGDAPAPDT